MSESDTSSSELAASSGATRDRHTGETTPKKKRRLGAFGEILFIIVGALVISAVLRHFVFQTFSIPSGSMENTLQVGDRVVAMQIGGFKRGDVVVFEDSQKWLNQPVQKRSVLGQIGEAFGILPTTDKNYLIKRVIGTPGDRVKCCDAQGRMSVNGVPLTEDSYLYSEGGVTVQPAAVPFEVVVPKDRIFVMGDHRNESGDSRCHLADISVDGGPRGMSAFVPESAVVGPAKLIMAPLSRWQTLSVPDTFKNIPPPKDAPPDTPFISPEGVGC